MKKIEIRKRENYRKKVNQNGKNKFNYISNQNRYKLNSLKF